MLTISTKSDYGLAVLVDLAKSFGKDYIALSDIARRRQLSSSYITQIMQPLIKAKIITSKEGKGGGYSLARDPRDLSVLELVELLDGPISLVKCIKDGDKSCACAGACETKKIWPQIILEIKQALDKKSLADIVRGLK